MPIRRLLAVLGLAVITVAAVVAIPGVAGGKDPEDPPVACTEIGCASGVHVRYDRLPAGARSARICVDGRCGAAQRLYEGGGFLYARIPKAKHRSGAEVGVRIVVLDRKARVISRARTRATVKSFRPNGPGCPPTCYTAELRYDGAARRLRS